MTDNETTRRSPSNIRYIVVLAMALTAFFGAFGYARASKGLSAVAAVPGAGSQTAQYDAAARPEDPNAEGGAGGCACCGGGGGEETEGATDVVGGVQRIAVAASNGFSPSVIKAKAGVPLEISFGEGQGCMSQVMFKDFDVLEDLTNGGAVVKLPALEKGEYDFSCGMEMVFGRLVVE